jgi:exopolysaccharide biosynthesis protein
MRIIYFLIVLVFISPDCFSNQFIKLLPLGERKPAMIDGPITVWSEQLSAPRQIVVHFIKIDLTAPEVEVFVKLSPDPDGPDGPAEGVLTLPESLMKDSNILALINANAFAKVPSIANAPGKSGWYLGQMINIEGMAVADGKVRSPDQEGRLPFWLDEQGKPHLGHPGPKDKVRHAVSDWFSVLIKDSKLVGGTEAIDHSLLDESDRLDATIDLSIHPRSMLGFDDSGQWLLLAVVDGRRKGYSIGMSLAEQSELMKDKGCTQAINLDGGGSSIMIIRDENGNLVTVNRPSDGSHRPIPLMIGVRLRQQD